MALSNLQPQGSVAWVTGASSGIGAAVALELAARGWSVAVTARRLERLEALALQAAGFPGRIVAHAGDVTDPHSMRSVVEGVESVHGPITLAFLNAGMAPEAKGGGFDVEALEAALAVNTIGVARGIAVLLERMKPRGRGQIAVNASLAGYGGLPRAAAYGAAKAATIHLCESLKFDCDRHGIRLQVVNPGFVATAMTERHKFPMPYLLTEEVAARRIVEGFAHDRFEITFPRRLAWMLKFFNLLPYPVYFGLLKRLTQSARREQI